MKTKSMILFSLIFLLSACVPQRKYQELEVAYKEMEQKKKDCEGELTTVKAEKEEVKAENIQLKSRVSYLVTDSIEVHTLFASNQKLYAELKDSYDRLLKNNKLYEENLEGALKDLEAKLSAKEIALSEKEAVLNQNVQKNQQLKKELDSIQVDLLRQQQKIVELQSILNAKDSAVKALKTKLSDALLGFQDKGLTVEIRNGKVYVSMDEKLLFASGSTVVDSKGKEALMELAKTIRDIKDIHIMVEGHTDDVPISGGPIKDNWDLSVLRATSIVRILTKDGKVDPVMFIASGRGEYQPVDPAKTPTARAKNRRTEIIISPNLDEVFELLEQD